MDSAAEKAKRTESAEGRERHLKKTKNAPGSEAGPHGAPLNYYDPRASQLPTPG